MVETSNPKFDSPVNEVILTALEECQGYVSGEDLSRQLGLSRAAIWKRIRTLRQDGYRIEASPHRGYRLVERPDLLSAREIGRKLKAVRVAAEIHTLGEVSSTNDVAYELAFQGAREGVVVIAESQTQGRGRMSRFWLSPAGSNLYLSLILRPAIPPRLAPLLTYLGVIATAEALSQCFSLKVEVKWPNDVLVRGRKLAGLLNEVKAETDRVDFVVLGFGVNLNMEADAFPAELSEKATSVMRELGHRISRVEFTRSLLEWLDFWYNEFLLQGADVIIKKWEAVARIGGKTLEVSSFGDVYRGVAEGLDHDGALVIRTGKDETIRVVAGDVTNVSVQPQGPGVTEEFLDA